MQALDFSFPAIWAARVVEDTSILSAPGIFSSSQMRHWPKTCGLE
jgi:hypothetical protein